jgi:ribose-phosphate pyrophosphokinase
MVKIVKSMDDGANQKVLAIKEEFVFPAGEVSVKLNVNDYAYKYFDAPFQTIVARIQNGDDLFKLALLKDALQRFDPTPINLFLTYLPYARQDRVCDGGEAFSLAVLARFIASLRFNHVTLFDPHSDVAQGCFEALEVPLTVIRQNDVIHKYQAFSNFASNRLLVSPDVGANKKTSVIAGYFNHSGFIRADKLRDLSTGKIKEIVVYCDDLHGEDVIIVDDLCEKGGTFIGLALKLKQKNCGKVILYVTHGVFGGKEKDSVIQTLLANGIDEIFTTNSYHTDLVESDRFHVLDLEKTFADTL